MMRFYFSLKVTTIGLVLAGLMVRASFWQWDRYQQKQAYIQKLSERLAQPVTDFAAIGSQANIDWSGLIHRRVRFTGRYDFSHEMALRNRRYRNISGIYAITPLELDTPTPSGAPKHVLVSRGFIPLSKASRDGRKQFQKEERAEFIGLIKESMYQKLFAPADPETGPGHAWADGWLRVDVPKMSRQLPYPVLPIYVEVMGDEAQGEMNIEAAKEKMVETRSGRDEMFFLPGQEDSGIQQVGVEPDLPYPIAVYDTVIPPGRHFGYVFEWAIMALITVLICVVLQLRPGNRGA